MEASLYKGGKIPPSCQVGIVSPDIHLDYYGYSIRGRMVVVRQSVSNDRLYNFVNSETFNNMDGRITIDNIKFTERVQVTLPEELFKI